MVDAVMATGAEVIKKYHYLISGGIVPYCGGFYNRSECCNIQYDFKMDEEDGNCFLR